MFDMGVLIVESRWIPENRFPPVRQTIHPWRYRRHLLLCLWGFMGDVSHEYHGVLKVIRRSRATLIFSMGIFYREAFIIHRYSLLFHFLLLLFIVINISLFLLIFIYIYYYNN